MCAAERALKWLEGEQRQSPTCPYDTLSSDLLSPDLIRTREIRVRKKGVQGHRTYVRSKGLELS